MKKLDPLWAVLAVAIVMVPILVPREASAVPAFARQTGMACITCHFQHFPALNAFGRSFKMTGYTLIGPQGKVESEGLSIPDTLNASLVTKIRYQKTNGDSDAGTDRGELQFPDEGALLFGGRAGQNVGFLLEAQLIDDTAPVFASFKVPMVWDVAGMKFNVIPFTTDAAGAAYGFELLNTGGQRMQRVLEERSVASAQQYVGTATNAEGVALALANNMGFINATLWGPAHGVVAAGTDFSHYFRAAVTPTLGGWDTGAGIQYWGGKTKVRNDGDPAETVLNTQAWALDAQAQGVVGEMPLGIYVTYASAAKDDEAGETFSFNDGNPNDKTAWTILADLGVLPNKATVALGYRGGDNGEAADSSDNAAIFGVTYHPTQNLELQANHVIFSGDAYDSADADQRTTLMLFSAF